MKLSKKLKNKIKRNISKSLASLAIVTTTLAVGSLTDFSTTISKTMQNIFRSNEVVLTPTEKQEEIQDFSSSSNLNAIYIGESKIQGFKPQKLNYEVILENKIDEINLSVDKQTEGQEVTGIGTISLTGEKQDLEVVVVSENKQNTSTYTISISYKTENVETKNSYSFEYTGEAQEFIAPYTGYYKMELWGAQGGSYSTVGGKGAYTSGNIYLKEGEKVYVYVGQTGNGIQDKMTFNGGGASGTLYYSRAGGGSTDIRLSSGTWNDFDSLKSRIMVAAGGGGSTADGYNCNGGAGGALTGYNGSRGGSGGGYTVAGGGTQTSPGTPGRGAATAKSAGFGYGGSGNANHGGGGRRRLLWWWPELAIIIQ